MKRFVALLAVPLAACQQASPHADDAKPKVVANLKEKAAEARPTAPEPAAIPAKFRGTWAEGRAACAQLSHPSRLIISESVIRYPSLALVGEEVDRPTDSSFAVKGHNQRTGAPAEAHYSIDAAGGILTDEAGGGAVRVRCG